MSVSGNLAMGVLRVFKPGKGSFSDVEKCRARAKRENEGFVFSWPKRKNAAYALLDGVARPCLVITPKTRGDAGKAVLYLYGGVSNNWNTQKNMAADFAAATGVETWYPVYPAITEVCVTDVVAYLLGVYRRMLERFDARKIALCGVSMGGFYALQMVNMIRHEGLDLPAPGLLLAHSPGGTPDSEADWDELRKYEKRDPMFAESDLRMIEKIMPCDGPLPTWALSPSRGDFTGAPPAYLYYGEEMLAGNAVLYRRAFDRCGVGDRLHITIEKNMMHGYSCMPVFPESRKAYYETVGLVQKL